MKILCDQKTFISIHNQDNSNLIEFFKLSDLKSPEINVYSIGDFGLNEITNGKTLISIKHWKTTKYC